MANSKVEVTVAPEVLITDRIEEFLSTIAKEHGLLVTHISVGWAETMGSDGLSVAQVNIDFEKKY